MSKVPDQINLIYSDIIEQWGNRKYFQGYLTFMTAPYRLAFNLIADFLKTEAVFSDNEAENIEKIILAGQKSGAKKVTLKISKEATTGVDAAMGKLKARSKIKVTVGKNSNLEYVISVEYK